MAVGDDNAIWGPPIATTEELDGKVLRAAEMVCEVGPFKLRLGDGVTVGGIVIGSDTGGTGTGGIGFKTIGVTGSDAATWVNADQVNDTLMFTGIRGFVIQPNASADSISFGLPHGGAIGNGFYWTGTTWVASEPVAPPYEPQEGFANTDLLLETEGRKFFDGYTELNYFSDASAPVETVTFNNVVYASMPATGTSAVMAIDRLPICVFDALSVYVKLRTAATSGSIVLNVKLARVTNISSAFSYEDVTEAIVAVPDTGADFATEIEITDIGAITGGDRYCLHVARLADDGDDNCASAVTVVDLRIRQI